MKIQACTNEDKKEEYEKQYHNLIEEYQNKHSIFKQLN